MDISLGKDNALHLQGRGVSMAIGPSLLIKADVFFTTNGIEPKVEVGKYFQGAGEYEVQGVMVDGVATGKGVTSYHVIAESISLAAVTLNKAEDLTDDMLESLQPSKVLVLWLAEGSVQDVAQLMSRFDVGRLIPAKIPCDIDSLEKELQLKAETVSRLKLTPKDNIEEIRLLTVLDEV